jgi:hypothetical protein
VLVLDHAERGEASFQDLAEARLWCEHITGEIERRPVPLVRRHQT